jgi:hypothetical protein
MGGDGTNITALKDYDEENRNSMRGIDADGIDGSEVTGL